MTVTAVGRDCTAAHATRQEVIVVDEFTPNDMAGKLAVGGFSRSGPAADVASDPIVDTPMVVTLDQLRPYEHDPRVTRNPLYDDIKASIRGRGLDAPPPITRRPGAAHYIIRNGGNTRLAILRELWSETKDERFFQVACLFRPWPERGDIVALSGHLAESELHGRLTFVERALGVEKMRAFYEQALDKTLSQSELARCLAADGFPVAQPHISRMQEVIRYLLPYLPNVLYQGLGRPYAERLVMLRKTAESLWLHHAMNQTLPLDFDALFEEVLVPFDLSPDDFTVDRVQDELVDRMAKLLGVSHNELHLDIENGGQWQRLLSLPPQAEQTPGTAVVSTPRESVAPSTRRPTVPQDAGATLREAVTSPPTAENNPPLPAPIESVPASTAQDRRVPAHRDDASRVREHIVSAAASTDRLQAIQQLVAAHTGEPQPDFADQALRAIPVQAGGLYPISDVWYIEPGLDSPERLRIHIAQFAHEIASEAGIADLIEAVNAGIGFTCAPLPAANESTSMFSHAVLALLRALSAHYAAAPFGEATVSLNDRLGSLLLGSDIDDADTLPCLSDTGLVKLFRLIRLARRLLHLEAFPDERPS